MIAEDKLTPAEAYQWHKLGGALEYSYDARSWFPVKPETVPHELLAHWMGMQFRVAPKVWIKFTTPE